MFLSMSLSAFVHSAGIVTTPDGCWNNLMRLLTTESMAQDV